MQFQVFNAGPDGLPQLPTHVLEEFEDVTLGC